MGKFPFESKTFWSGVAIMLTAAADVANTKIISPADVTAFFTGLGLIGLRQAVSSTAASPAPAAASHT